MSSFLSRGLSVGLAIVCLLLMSAGPLNDGLDAEVVRYTNDFRESLGLAALITRDELNIIARGHSEDMAERRCSFGHDGYDEREVKVQKIIKPFYGMAENVAYGATTAKEVVSLWKSSPGHRKNMLGNYKYVGIGTAKDKQGVIYYTEIFVR